jgi:hypothetical protein
METATFWLLEQFLNQTAPPRDPLYVIKLNNFVFLSAQFFYLICKKISANYFGIDLSAIARQNAKFNCSIFI